MIPVLKTSWQNVLIHYLDLDIAVIFDKEQQIT